MTDDKSKSKTIPWLQNSFPFDGTCERSCDGDLTLEFTDGSSLKTHAALLKMASDTFHTMLTDCTKPEMVLLKETSREAWILILNCLHPAIRSSFLGFDPFRHVELLVSELKDHEDQSVKGRWILG